MSKLGIYVQTGFKHYTTLPVLLLVLPLFYFLWLLIPYSLAPNSIVNPFLCTPLFENLGEEKLKVPYSSPKYLYLLESSEPNTFKLAICICLTYFLEMGETLISMFLNTRFS